MEIRGREVAQVPGGRHAVRGDPDRVGQREPAAGAGPDRSRYQSSDDGGRVVRVRTSVAAYRDQAVAPTGGCAALSWRRGRSYNPGYAFGRMVKFLAHLPIFLRDESAAAMRKE